MHKEKGVIAMILFLTFAFFVSFAQAAEERIPLKGQLWERVKAEAIIKDTGTVPGEKELTLDVRGLQPNSIYTVWLLNEEPVRDMTGAGAADHYFKTDGSGNGRYVANISESELENWQKLAVALHPDGDPENVGNSVIALKGDLKVE